MKIEGTVGFIGTGNMAEALIRGLLNAGVAEKDQVIGSDPREDRCAEMSGRYGIRVVADNLEVARQADILVLSVKPQAMAKVLDQVGKTIHSHALVISIAAGIPLVAIEAKLPQARVIRTMPNTPALVGAGATAIAAGGHATDDDARSAATSASSTRSGTTVMLEEAQMDARHRPLRQRARATSS